MQPAPAHQSEAATTPLGAATRHLAVAQARRALLDAGTPLRLRRMAWFAAKSDFGHPVTQSRFLLLFGRA